MRHLIGVLTAATLLAGCTAYSTLDPLGTTASLLGTEGILTVKATFVPGGYTDPGAPHVAAVVPNLTKSSVNHVSFAFFSVEGEAETALKDASGQALVKRLSPEEAEKGLAIDGFTLGKTYRVRAVAYKTAESTASSQISAAAAAEFALDKGKPAKELSLRLTDVPFSGEATSAGIEVTPGDGLTHEGPIEIEPQPLT